MWNFNKVGAGEAVKEFIVSALKNVTAAGAGALGTFLLDQITVFQSHLATGSDKAVLATALAVLVRAGISAFLVWVNTWPSNAALPNSGISEGALA